MRADGGLARTEKISVAVTRILWIAGHVARIAAVRIPQRGDEQKKSRVDRPPIDAARRSKMDRVASGGCGAGGVPGPRSSGGRSTVHHYMQTDGSPAQLKPASTWHVAEQPSPSAMLPSSQPSAPPISPSPQVVAHAEGEPMHP